MKIKIGEYPNRLVCNIHTRHMNKKYEGLSYENHTHEDHVLEVIEESVQSVYNVFNWIWFDRRTQKIKVRIDKWDTWSMDTTLAHIVLPMLVQLKRTKHGAPNVDNADVPKELRMSKKGMTQFAKDGSTDDKFFKRWDWILDEMIWAFDQKCEMIGKVTITSTEKWDQRNLKILTIFLVLNLYGKTVKDRDAHQKRMTNGFKLFGKYYENLWD